MAVIAGTQALTTTAVKLPEVDCVEVILIAPSSNAVNVLVGDATSQPFVMIPGATLRIACNDVSDFWAKAASTTANIQFLASRI